MAKFTWTDVVNGVDIVDADHINSIAHAVLSNQESIEQGETILDNLGAETEKNTKSIEELELELGIYTDPNIVGVRVDFENNTFERLAGAKGLTAGADFDKFDAYKRRRCNLSDSGTIKAFYGDSAYRDDGANDQVMVYQPSFYYRVVPRKLAKNTDTNIGYHIQQADYFISSTPHEGFKLHPAFYNKNGNVVDYICLAAYEGVVFKPIQQLYVYSRQDYPDSFNPDTDYLCSVANRKPTAHIDNTSSMSPENINKMASHRGDGWSGDTIQAESATQLLMLIEFATFDVQSVLGKGVTVLSAKGVFRSALTGSTAELGNNSGQATSTVFDKDGVSTTYTENGNTAISYRGQENIYGNLWTYVDGIEIVGEGAETCGGVPNAPDSADFTLSNTSDYIKYFGYGNPDYDWLFLPSQNGGTSIEPVGDYIYLTPNLLGTCQLTMGGCFADQDRAGAWCMYVRHWADNTITGRLLYVPTA